MNSFRNWSTCVILRKRKMLRKSRVCVCVCLCVCVCVCGCKCVSFVWTFFPHQPHVPLLPWCPPTSRWDVSRFSQRLRVTSTGKKWSTGESEGKMREMRGRGWRKNNGKTNFGLYDKLRMRKKGKKMMENSTSFSKAWKDAIRRKKWNEMKLSRQCILP